METQENIVNKVAASGIVTFNLEDFYPKQERVLFDIKDQLYEGLILREKDFRLFLKEHDWSVYKDKFIAVHCSADAIVPAWAFMMIAINLGPFALKVVKGDLDRL